MAESFSNYCSKFDCKTTTTSNQNILVPKAGGSLSGNNRGSRPPGAITQIHSIYISQEISATYANPLDHVAYINLKIKDETSGQTSKEYYLANNVMVLPHSDFYIEKTITLLSQQSLIMEYTTLNTNNMYIDCVCSGVDIVQ